MKFKTSSFTCKLFSQNTLCAVGGTSKAFVEWFSKQTDDKDLPKGDDRTAGMTLYGDGFFAIWTQDGSSAHIAHEAVHLAIHVFEDRGIKPDEEILAYMVEFIVRNYTKELL